MKRKILNTVFILGIISVFSGSAFSGMSSENYRITTSVLSGGGEPMASTNYQTTSTAGQPSPLMDPDYPPYSGSYDLYSGFWYTLDSVVSACAWDFDPPDGDVDGSDLADFADGFAHGTYDLADLAGFAAEYGKTDCSD